MNKIAVSIGDKFGSPLGQTLMVGGLISIIISVAFAVASIIIVFLLISGGLSIISGAGSDNPENVKKGQQAITSAVVGFVIVFVAFWIIRIIELITGVNFITIPNL